LIFGGGGFKNELIAQTLQLLNCGMDDLIINFGCFAGIGNVSPKRKG
jgi:hypothetical protein